METPHPFPELPLFYSVPDAVKTLRISRSFFYKLVHNQGVQLSKVGRRSFIHRDELAKLIHPVVAAGGQ